jgi:hypothetical protein
MKLAQPNRQRPGFWPAGPYGVSRMAARRSGGSLFWRIGTGSTAASQPALAAGFTGFGRVELVRATAGMRCFSTFAGNLALALGVHGRKTAPSRSRAGCLFFRFLVVLSIGSHSGFLVELWKKSQFEGWYKGLYVGIDMLLR